tara:strand:+ start:809 stop:1069 length:261 start_codon:yes stop_codon:yes gene_type:complete
MKKRIHINQHVIKANTKNNERNPVITVKTSRDNTYGHEVYVDGPCVIKYSPDKPLSCGAKVWVETSEQVDIWQVKENGNMSLVGRK